MREGAKPRSPVSDVVFLFFFQAEDGIRDGHVTGVQTCALPIYAGQGDDTGVADVVDLVDTVESDVRARAVGSILRRCRGSEERRVGKECRSRGSAYD